MLEKDLHLSGAVTSSPYETDLVQTLRTQFPELEIRQNTLLDGVELDVFIPSLKLNVEVDGMQHMGKLRIDRIRDSRLKETYSIETIRIRSFQGNFEDSVTDVVDYVNKLLRNSASA
jgi:very-short-patch-repair endonuclease